MIEISFGKLLLLAVIALIVLGPEKLPHAARTAGTLIRRLRAGWDSVRAEVERELEIEEIRRVAREAAAQAEAAQAKLNETQAQINDAVRKAQGVASADVATLLDDKGDAEAAPSSESAPDDAPLMTGKPLAHERGEVAGATEQESESGDSPESAGEPGQQELPRGHA